MFCISGFYLPDLVDEPRPREQESEEQKLQSRPGSEPEAERGEGNLKRATVVNAQT